MVDLVLDVRRGVTAEALLGALVEAGASLERIDAAVAALGRGEVRLQVQAGPSGSSMRIRAPQGAPVHETWADLRPRIELLAVDQDVASTTLKVLDGLFAARAAVHGVRPEDVGVDPLSGPDDLAEAVALAAASCSLGVGRITATPIGHGTGTLRTIEGDVQMPGPVVVRLLQGVATIELDVAAEVTDPVGAAYVVGVATVGVAAADDADADDARGRGCLPSGNSLAVLARTRPASRAV